MEYFTKQWFAENTSACEEGLDLWFPQEGMTYPALPVLVNDWVSQYGTGYIVKGLGMPRDSTPAAINAHIAEHGLAKAPPKVVPSGGIYKQPFINHHFMVVSQNGYSGDSISDNQKGKGVVVWLSGPNAGNLDVWPNGSYIPTDNPCTIAFIEPNKERKEF